jgi:hypothetical protein
VAETAAGDPVASAVVVAPSPSGSEPASFLPRRTLGEDGLVGGIVYRRTLTGTDIRAGGTDLR